MKILRTLFLLAVILGIIYLVSRLNVSFMFDILTDKWGILDKLGF